ncbi:MAG: AraC family transcriptional regulator [Bryobacteraceae bacterium]
MSVTSKALWYIESHLPDDVSLEAVAEAAGVSRFHMSRAFASATGLSLAGYVRARRLSVAAETLAAGAPGILDVALAAGYGSHEAFTRAFRQHFGLSPQEFREAPGETALPLQEAIRVNPATRPTLPTPTLKHAGEMLIFGLGQPCKLAGDPGIPALWNRFVPHIGHIEGQAGSAAYGVIHNADEAGSYEYICGAEVRRFPSQPAEFQRVRIPAQSYAVFDIKDHISAIGPIWKAIWEHGLSDARFKAADAPAFERYGEQFNGATGMGGFEIWVPIVT